MAKKIDSIKRGNRINNDGRNARKGFVYQDHVGVKILIESLGKINIKEVWFETHDDIEIHSTEENIEIVEFVQVKHENKQSGYSLHELLRRDKSNSIEKEGTSLFEKSLNQAKFSEESRFRLVTSSNVKDDVKYLTYNRYNGARNNKDKEAQDLLIKINSKCPNVESENGTTALDWINKCYWEVRPHKKDDLESVNLSSLGKVIKQVFNSNLLFGHLDDLSERLLSKVRTASTINLDDSPNGNKINMAELREYIIDFIDKSNKPKGDSLGLQDKFKDAKIMEDYVSTAANIAQKYSEVRYDSDYMSSSVFSDLEMEVSDKLFSLLQKLDSGEFAPGIQFLDICYEEVKKIPQQEKYRKSGIAEHHAIGYMYKLTNRCPHRFHRVA